MIRHHLTYARLTLRIWLTSGWIEDTAWGLRVGTTVGLAAGLAGLALGWW